MIEIVRRTQRNVKRWHDGEMGLRWTAAGMLEAERQFRRVIGYRELPALVFALERELKSTEVSTASGTSSLFVIGWSASGVIEPGRGERVSTLVRRLPFSTDSDFRHAAHRAAGS